MASLKNTLRELSVIYGLGVHFNNAPSKPSKKIFMDILSLYLPPSQLKLISRFPFELNNPPQREILKNGIILAEAIIKTFKIKKVDTLKWTGLSTQSRVPIDLWINKFPFSLKEESYILENMGLYKLMNLLTGSSYKRGGLHIFKNFAREEYERWFKITWRLLYTNMTRGNDGIRWSYTGNGYKSYIEKKGDKLIFLHNKKGVINKAVFLLSPSITLEKFEKMTNSTLREKVFSKWINSEVSRNRQYLDVKRDCAVAAGKRIEDHIKKKLSKSRLARLLQVYEIEYYYAKVTNLKPRIFKIPGADNFENIFSIESIDYKVPSSQLNLHTLIKNKKTNKTLELRNEIRFSHGQFNGTPEAKLYYARGNSLDTVYIPLEIS